MKNKLIIKRGTGFTLIEVMIFLAITGLLMAGAFLVSSTAIARHRYNDAVQDFTQFLREQYGLVVNPQIPTKTVGNSCVPNMLENVLDADGKFINQKYVDEMFVGGTFGGGMFTNNPRGRSSCVLYGVVVTFGGNGGHSISTMPLIGKDFTVLASDHSDDLVEFASFDDIDLLGLAGISGSQLYVELVKKDQTKPADLSNLSCRLRATAPPPATTYNLRWTARTETNEAGSNPFSGSLIIFRSPRNGTVQTFFTRNSLTQTFSSGSGPGSRQWTADEINNTTAGMFFGNKSDGTGNCQGNFLQAETDATKIFTEALKSDGGGLSKLIKSNRDDFSQEDLLICINSEDAFAYAGQRRMIRIRPRIGRNETAVELVDHDLGDVGCE